MSHRFIIVVDPDLAPAQSNAVSQLLAVTASYWVQHFKGCWLIVDETERTALAWRDMLVLTVPGRRFLVMQVGNEWGAFADPAQLMWLQFVWEKQ